MKDPPKEAKEQGGDTEAETSNEEQRPLGQPTVYTPSEKVCLEVPAEQKLAPSTHVSLGTIDLDSDEETLAKEPKSVG